MKYLDKLIKVNAKCRTKKYYQSLGYEEIDGNFYVSCDDLLDNSSIEEVRKCDCCGKDFSRRHEHHIKTFERFGKDICGECVATLPELRKIIQNKKEDSWNKKYGCHPMKIDEIKNKVYDSWDEKYGGHPMHNEEIRKKWEDIVSDKYGGLSPLCNEEIRAKSKETLKSNGNIPTSSQQIKIFNILCDLYDNDHCNLNYLVSDLALDVMIEVNDIKIDIEYDGNYWHQDEQKDRRRDEFVKSQGYKVLRIKAKHKIPTIQQLQDAINDLVNTEYKFMQINLE